MCKNNEADCEYHYRAVCRGLYAQAYELKVFLSKIEDSKVTTPLPIHLTPLFKLPLDPTLTVYHSRNRTSCKNLEKNPHIIVLKY